MDEGKVSLGDGRAGRGGLGAGGETGFYGSGRKGLSSRSGPVRPVRALRRPAGRYQVMLLVVIATVALVASGAAALLLRSAPEAAPADSTVSGPVIMQPQPPLLIFGYLKDEVGNPVAGATVTVTNVNLGASITTTSEADGFYQAQLADIGYAAGHTITIEAVKDSMTGSATYVVTGSEPGYAWIDITMVLIPEFPAIIVPVVGMVAVVAVVRLFRGRRGES